MKATMYFFSSPTCPHCPSAKRIALELSHERDDFELKLISTMDRDGQKIAQKYGVMTVPTFIIKGPGFPENIGLRGGQGKDVLNKYIDKALGKVEEEKKKGFKIGRYRFKF